MKNLTVTVQIQFDQYGDGDSTEYAIKKLDEVNQVLQREFDDVSPIIFTNSIDSSDVHVDTPEDEEE